MNSNVSAIVSTIFWAWKKTTCDWVVLLDMIKFYIHHVHWLEKHGKIFFFFSCLWKQRVSYSWGLVCRKTHWTPLLWHNVSEMEKTIRNSPLKCHILLTIVWWSNSLIPLTEIKSFNFICPFPPYRFFSCSAADRVVSSPYICSTSANPYPYIISDNL